MNAYNPPPKTKTKTKAKQKTQNQIKQTNKTRRVTRYSRMSYKPTWTINLLIYIHLYMIKNNISENLLEFVYRPWNSDYRLMVVSDNDI